MTIIALLIMISIIVAGGFLGLFVWAVRSGQFEDTITPSMRILFEDKLESESEKLNSDQKKLRKAQKH